MPLLIALRRRRKKESNMWVRPIFSLFRKQGEYNLLQEMRFTDREAHFLHIQWNPSIVATIQDQPFGLYRGVATSQGLFYIID